MLRYALSCLAGSMLAVVLAGGVAGAQPNKSPIAPAFFGMHIASPDRGWPPFAVGALGKVAGATWAYVEPARGVFQWYGIDHALAAADSHGVDFFYAFANTPQWASARPTEFCDHGNVGCAAPPSKIEYWNEFVTALATRYKGRIKFYEIWDEANASPVWSGSYAELVLLAKNAYAIIKSIDPDASVLTPATTGDIGYQPAHSALSGISALWLDGYLQAGGDRYADGGNWHGYLTRTATAGYRMPEDDDSPCHMDSWNYTRNCAGSILKEVDTMRAILDRHNMANRPLFNSEGSWGKDNLPDPDLQAAWIARYYLLQAGKGVTRVYWDGWDLDGWGSLKSVTGGSNLAGIAFQQIYRWLVGATMANPCSATANHTTWTCTLTRPGGYRALAIWDVAGDQTYTPDSQYIEFRDLAGHVSPMHDSVSIGVRPILVETRPAP